MRRKTSHRRHLPTRFIITRCQIITVLILKSDNIENSRIESKGIVLPVPSNQIKVTFIIILPFNLVLICDFFLFHIEIEGKCGWIIGGGGCGEGAKRYVAPPSNYWGTWPSCPPPPTPTPSSYAYDYQPKMQKYIKKIPSHVFYITRYTIRAAIR